MDIGQTGCFPEMSWYGPHPYAGLRVRRIPSQIGQGFVAVDDLTRTWLYVTAPVPQFIDVI